MLRLKASLRAIAGAVKAGLFKRGAYSLKTIPVGARSLKSMAVLSRAENGHYLRTIEKSTISP